MPFVSHEGVRYFIFESLASEGVQHGVFTRQGGVSPFPWATLNLGATVGDDLQRVRTNLERVFSAVGRPLKSKYDTWLVHGTDLAIAEAPRREDQPPTKADVVLTDRPEVTLLMRYADCVPILLCDPLQRVVGLVHAGWQGTVNHIARIAVEVSVERYGSRPENLLAAIGPSIGPDHYAVGEQVIAQVRWQFGSEADALLPEQNGQVHFDLWQANRLDLERAGVGQIECADLCTACHLEDWYSHRAEGGRTGRFGALISL